MDDDSSPKAGASTMVPVAIGLVGVLLGAAALYFSLSNRGATAAIIELKQDLSDTAAIAKSAEKQASDLDSKFAALVETNSSLSTSIQNVTGQVNDALNRMGTAVTEDRQQIKAQGDAIQQLSSKSSASAASTAAASTSEKSTPAATTTATPGPGGVHVIVSGDTFGSLARKYGVSVSAIEAANPDASPNKLHLGQKINIPPTPAPGAASAASGTAAPAPAASTPATAPTGN